MCTALMVAMGLELSYIVLNHSFNSGDEVEGTGEGVDILNFGGSQSVQKEDRSILQAPPGSGEGKAWRRRLSTLPKIFLPTIDISLMIRYLMSEVCCSLMSLSPSRSLNSPLVGRLRRECMEWPSILKAATPVGEVMMT